MSYFAPSRQNIPGPVIISGNLNVTGDLDVDGSTTLVNTTTSGKIIFDTGVAITAGNYEMARDADATNQMHWNIPTGASFEWSINDSPEMTLNAATLDVGGALDLSAGLTWDTGVATTAGAYQIIRNNDATNRLQFNIPTGATFEFSINDASTMILNATALFIADLADTTSINNANISLDTTGITISRNVADANIPLIVDRVHASATGDITEFRAASSPVFSIDGSGGIIFEGSGATVAGNYEIRRDNAAQNHMQLNVPTSSSFEFSVNGVVVMDLNVTRLNISDIANLNAATNSRIILDTTGLTLERNIADANPAVILSQKHASSTGDILQLKNSALTLLTVAQGGLLTLSLAGNTSRFINSTDNASVQVMRLEGDRATMADNDEAYLSLMLSNDGGTQKEFGRITWVGTDINAATSEDGRLDFAVMTAGSLADELQLDGTALSPSTDGGIALGTTSLGFNGLNLNTATVIDWENGNVTLTHATNTLTLAGSITNFTYTQAVSSSGVPTGFLVTGGAHTGITAATEQLGTYFNFSATKTWAAGAGPLATQREIFFRAPTYNGNAAGALTITTAATVYIDGAPTQGTNITLSNRYALWIDTGVSAFGGHIVPDANDGAQLGTTALQWSDLMLASGAVINFASGNVTLTHGSDILTLDGDFTVTDGLVKLNKSSAGIAIDLNVTATTYTNNAAALDIARTGNLTGIDTQNILDFLIMPAFTLTQPVSGSITYIAATIDLSSVAITAAAGDSDTYALRLVACSDADSKSNTALFVDTGKVNFAGGGTNRIGSTQGALLEMGTSTITGNNASETLAVGAAISLGVTTFANGTATLTFTDATNLYIAGIPVASTNVAITNTATALWVDAGNVRFDGDILLPTTGAAINFASGDVTVTHAANTLTFAGATSGYAFNNGPVTTGADVDVNMSAGGRLYGGGIQANKQDLGANTNLTLDENDSVVNVTTGAVSVNTITLPTASGNEGMIVSVYLVTDGGQNANVVRAGTNVIQNGSADLGNTQIALDDAGDFVMLQCVNSTMWQILVNSGGTVT